ncbi:transmembrane emp24 domain-containing protein 9-like isoform X1 [Manis pentadactyla]|uniref:transmembrane emp24 domain-containing protein 9-like isoform X1 n=1 Tax=Manis pentadactyla TaxID=143292 RepID=UPI00255CDE03|nr:transmembrane emp24 domain-containing protein 9-like isoform X1 [Manis pentadactyla]
MAAEQGVRVVWPWPGVGLSTMVRAFLLLLCFAARGGALYFHIGETEKKCFIEEIPDETMVIGNYRTQLYDKQREEYQPATPGLGMFVEVKDPGDKVSWALSPAESSALHLAPDQAGAGSSPPGFRICQTAKDSWWCGKIRIFTPGQTWAVALLAAPLSFFPTAAGPRQISHLP